MFFTLYVDTIPHPYGQGKVFGRHLSSVRNFFDVELVIIVIYAAIRVLYSSSETRVNAVALVAPTPTPPSVIAVRANESTP